MNFSTPTKVTFGPPEVSYFSPDAPPNISFSPPNAPVAQRSRSFTVGGYIKVLSPTKAGVYFLKDLFPKMKVEECDPNTLFSGYFPSYVRLVKISSIDMPRFVNIPTSWNDIIYIVTQGYRFPLIERSTPEEYGPAFCNYDPANDNFNRLFHLLEEPVPTDDPIFPDIPFTAIDDTAILDDWFSIEGPSDITC